MSGFQELKDYINYSLRPFTSSEIVSEFSISFITANKYLKRLVSESFIKKIGNKGKQIVYITNKNCHRSGKQNVTSKSLIERYHRQVLKPSKQAEDLQRKTEALIDAEINKALKRVLLQIQKDYEINPKNEDFHYLISLLNQVQSVFQGKKRKE